MKTIGLLPFLNVKPLSYLLEHEPLPEGWSLKYAPPSKLAEMLKTGEICSAPVSSFACFENPNLGIVPGICIASHGPVTSVLMFSRKPFEQVQTVALDSGSLSGASMLKIILKERYGVSPEFVRCEPDIDLMLAECDAGLLLGNKAMQTAVRNLPGLHVMDLGTEWMAMTGLPAVFAVWAVTPDAPLDQLLSMLNRSKEAGMRSIDKIAEEEAPKLGLPYELCRDYLAKVMVFDLGDREIAGLRAFADKAYEHGLLEHRPNLQIVTAGSLGQGDLYFGTSFSSRSTRDGAEVSYASGHAFRPEARTTSESTMDILDRVLGGERLSEQDAIALFTKARLPELGIAADEICSRFHVKPLRTYVIDRNINYTNICASGCRFCAFYEKPGSPNGYVLTNDQVLEKVREAVDLGATQILMQGGMNPDLGLDYYESLLRAIKSAFPKVQVHSFSAPEIVYIAKLSNLSVEDTLHSLRSAGLDSLPGGGAEILVDSVRTVVSPHKCSVAEWVRVMEFAADCGMRATATMMFGHVESFADRVRHLAVIRDLQDRTGVFTAFIPWTFQPGNTDLGGNAVGGHDYLRTLAISRLFLDNVENLQASWVTQGDKMAQIALRFGANDIGSTMIEENVVAAAGVSFSLSEADLIGLIQASGFDAVQRDTLYRHIKVHASGVRAGAGKTILSPSP